MQQNRDFEVSQKFFWIDVLTTDGPIKRGTLQKGAFRILASLKWTVPNPSSQVTKIWGGAIAARKVWYKYKYSQMTIQIQGGLLYSFLFCQQTISNRSIDETAKQMVLCHEKVADEALEHHFVMSLH